MGHGLEQGLVYGDLRVGVNRVVSDVQILGDLGLRKLFNNAFSWLLIFNELTGNLLNGLRVMCAYFLHRLEFEWFSQSFIALFYINLLTITKKLPLFKKKDIKNHYFFFYSYWLYMWASCLQRLPLTVPTFHWEKAKERLGLWVLYNSLIENSRWLWFIYINEFHINENLIYLQ